MKGIIIAGIMALGSLPLCGCAHEADFAAKQRSFGGDIAAVSIFVKDRKVMVGPSEGDELLFKYQDSDKEALRFELSGATLEVELESNKGFGDFFGTLPDVSYRTIEVYVPLRYQVSINISTANEDVLISGLSVDGLAVSNSNGGITIADLSSDGDIALATKNADITGNIIGSYDEYSIRVDVKKGQTNLPSSKPGGDKKLSAQNNNGDVFLDLSPVGA